MNFHHYLSFSTKLQTHPWKLSVQTLKQDSLKRLRYVQGHLLSLKHQWEKFAHHGNVIKKLKSRWLEKLVASPFLEGGRKCFHRTKEVTHVGFSALYSKLLSITSLSSSTSEWLSDDKAIVSCSVEGLKGFSNSSVVAGYYCQPTPIALLTSAWASSSL